MLHLDSTAGVINGRDRLAGDNISDPTKHVPSIAVLHIFRLCNYFLSCNKFPFLLLLLTLPGLIALLFDIVAVLDIIGHL